MNSRTVFNPEISALIPTHNGTAWVARTLDLLSATSTDVALEIIVVDNASTDGTAELCGRSSNVSLIRNEVNRGFSRAVNQAAEMAQGRILAVINQDLYLKDGALRAIRGFLSSRNAIVGGSLFFQNGEQQPSCGPFPSLAGTMTGLLLPRRKWNDDDSAPRTDHESVWVTGAFMAFNREVFDAIGGFDEGFFMYYEDVDFCLRARQAGFPTYFLPEAKAVHVNPHASRKKEDVPVWLQKEIRRSQMRYFKKHRPRWESAAINALNRAYYAAHGWPWP